MFPEKIMIAKQTELVAESHLPYHQFAELFERYHNRILKYMSYRVHDKQTAEDLASQVFERVIQNHHQFDETKAPVEVWIFAIARNVLIDYQRRVKKYVYTPLETLEHELIGHGSPEYTAEKNELGGVLQKVLQRLSENNRTIIALKYAAGMKNPDIAKLMGRSENNIATAVYRTLKKLKKELAKEGVVFHE